MLEGLRGLHCKQVVIFQSYFLDLENCLLTSLAGGLVFCPGASNFSRRHYYQGLVKTEVILLSRCVIDKTNEQISVCRPSLIIVSKSVKVLTLRVQLLLKSALTRSL